MFVEDEIPPASEVLEDITQPLADASEAVQEATTGAIHGMSESLRLHGETLQGHTGLLDNIQSHLVSVTNTLNQLSTQLATAAVDIPSEAVQEAAADIPAATDAVETELEQLTEAPKTQDKKRRRRRRRGD
jgi:uncharacterized phage infection (PIP) family protein YhgE